MRLACFVVLLALLTVSSPFVYAAVTTNATVSSTAGRLVPCYRIVHDTTQIASGQRLDLNNDGSYDTDRNYTQDLAYADPLNLCGTRSDAETDNNAVYSSGNKSMTWRTDATNPLRNIAVFQNSTNWSAYRGVKIWNMEVPMNMKNTTDPLCASNTLDCGPTSWSDYGNITGQFGQKMLCNTLWSGKCAFSPWNEGYGANFLFPDGTCVQRIAALVYGWPYWFNETRMWLPTSLIVSPSFTYTNDACGEQMARAFLGNFSGTIYEPDYWDFHHYSGTGSMVALNVPFYKASDLAATYGEESKLITTEFNLNHVQITNGQQNRQAAELMSVTLTLLANTTMRMWAPYEWSCSGSGENGASYNGGCNESGIVFHAMENINSTPKTLGTYAYLNESKNVPVNSTTYNVTPANSLTTMQFFLVNSTYGRLSLVNLNNDTLTVQNLTFPSIWNLSSVRTIDANASQTVFGNQVNLSAVTNYGMQTYEVFFQNNASCTYSGPILCTSSGCTYETQPSCAPIVNQAPTNVQCTYMSQAQANATDDATGNGNTLSLTGPTYNSSYTGYTWPSPTTASGNFNNLSVSRLNGSSGYSISVDLIIDTCPSNSSHGAGLVAKNFAYGLQFNTNAASCRVFLRNRNATLTGSGAATTGTLSTGVAYNIVGTWNATTTNSSIYVNGVLVASVNDTVTNIVSDSLLWQMGSSTAVTGGNNRALTNTTLMDVKLWNRPLTPSEVATVYANGTVSSGLVASYPFTNQSQVGGCQ